MIKKILLIVNNDHMLNFVNKITFDDDCVIFADNSLINKFNLTIKNIIYGTIMNDLFDVLDNVNVEYHVIGMIADENDYNEALDGCQITCTKQYHLIHIGTG